MPVESRRQPVVEAIEPEVVQLLRKTSPEDRMAMASAAFRFARNMLRERLRREHPTITEDELDRLVLESLHGGNR